MAVLAIETTGKEFSVAAGLEDGSVLSSVSAQAGRSINEHLFSVLEECLQTAGITFVHIKKLALCHGPGSFTGIRAGIAAVRALALVSQKPVWTASSLEIIAASVPPSEGGLLVAHQTRRNSVLLQYFNEPGTSAGKVEIVEWDAAEDIVPPDWVSQIAGNAATKFKKLGLEPVEWSLHAVSLLKFTLDAQYLVLPSQIKPAYIYGVDASIAAGSSMIGQP